MNSTVFDGWHGMHEALEIGSYTSLKIQGPSTTSQFKSDNLVITDNSTLVIFIHFRHQNGKCPYPGRVALFLPLEPEPSLWVVVLGSAPLAQTWKPPEPIHGGSGPGEKLLHRKVRVLRAKNREKPLETPWKCLPAHSKWWQMTFKTSPRRAAEASVFLRKSISKLLNQLSCEAGNRNHPFLSKCSKT